MNIDDKTFQRLREAAANDDRPHFERLVYQIVQQAVRDTLAKRAASQPVRSWIPTAY